MTPTCNVCGSDVATAVASSVFGAISHAYCLDCALAGREVWSTMVGGLFGLTRDEVHPDLRPVIAATCAFYGRSEDELWKELDKLTADYEAAAARAETIASTARDIHGRVIYADIVPPKMKADMLAEADRHDALGGSAHLHVADTLRRWALWPTFEEPE